MATNGLPTFLLGLLLGNMSVNSVAFVSGQDRTDVSSLRIVGSLRDRCPSCCWPAPVLPRLRVRVSSGTGPYSFAQRVPLHSQVNVKNGGADQPSASDLTSFPGMYNGFKFPDIYTDNLDGFVVAGPNVVSFADNSSSGPSPSSVSSVSSSVSPESSSPSSYVSTPYPTNTPTNSTKTGTCRTKRNASKKRSFSARYIHRRSTGH
jgi:hypothetical protein